MVVCLIVKVIYLLFLHYFLAPWCRSVHMSVCLSAFLIVFLCFFVSLSLCITLFICRCFMDRVCPCFFFLQWKKKTTFNVSETFINSFQKILFRILRTLQIMNIWISDEAWNIQPLVHKLFLSGCFKLNFSKDVFTLRVL